MRHERKLLSLFVLAAALTSSGCSIGPGYDLLHLVGLADEPLVVTFVMQTLTPDAPPAEALNPFARWDPLHAELGKSVRRRVVPNLCFPFQLEPQLALGMCDVARVDSAAYAALSRNREVRVLGVQVDASGRSSRPAVLVVRAQSDIRAVEDLRRRTVAFGPESNGRTFHAGVVLLAAHGIQPKDLSLELLPIPGSFRHMPNARAVLQSVANQSSDAGFVDLLEWERLPESDPAGGLSRAQFRRVADTIAVPNSMYVASPLLRAATAEGVHRFLMECDQRAPETLGPLELTGFRDLSEEEKQACAALLTNAPAAPSAGASTASTPAPAAQPAGG